MAGSSHLHPATGATLRPEVVVLVGVAGSGKSTWAAQRFAPGEIVSSDALRLLAGRGESDLDASADAFSLLETVVEMRSRRRLSTVVDTLGADAALRARLRAIAASHGLACRAVILDTPAARCRANNAARVKRVPAAVLAEQLRRRSDVFDEVLREPFDSVERVVPPPSPEAAPAPSPTPAEPAAPTPAAPTPARSSAPTAPALPAPPPAAQPGPGPRFGLHLSAFPWPPEQHAERLRSLAGLAEEVGFDSLWAMDHFRQIPQVGRDWDDMHECFALLGHLAAATQRLTVGSLVASVTHRHPAVLANAVASLDVLSGGRAVCGLGLGWYAAEHAAYGMALPPVAQRYALLEDALVLLPLMWGKGTPAFHGRVLEVPQAICYPRPLAGRVPLLVGGSGARTLGIAARLADACNVFGDAAAVAVRVATLRAACDAAGRDHREVSVTHLAPVLIGRDRAAVTRRTERLRLSPRARAVSGAATVDDEVERVAALAAAGADHVIVGLAGIDEEAISDYGAVIARVRAAAQA